MARGSLEHSRSLLVSQAALVWATPTTEELNRFIRTGSLETSGADTPRMEYDPDALRGLVERSH